VSAPGLNPSEQRAHWHDAEGWAARLPDLRAQALRIAATVAPGSHGRRRAGTGDAFWQFRPYRTGDPSRSIDWRRSAQSDRHFVREREWQAAESFWLWLDTSHSMHFRGAANRPQKLERAAVLLLAIASLLLRSGERIGFLSADSARIIGTGHRAFDRLCDCLYNHQSDASVPYPTELPRHSTVLVFGDTWAPLNAWNDRLVQLSHPGVRGHIVQVIDPNEAHLALRGRVRVEGLEGEAPFLLRRAEDLASAYAARFTSHCKGLDAICQRLGWHFSQHLTGHSPLLQLLTLYQAISLDRRAPHA
jgi:uncharacterized protein (DUF58 family)